MNSLSRVGALAWLLLPLLVACSAGDGEAEASAGGASAENPGGSAYTKTCEQTACDSCLEGVEERCSRCYDLCSSPYADSSCFATCSSICSATCNSCSNSTSCLEWKVELPKQEFDQALFDACLAVENECAPDDYDISYCDYIARTMQKVFVELFSCALRNGCESNDCAPPPIGTLGERYCERAARCDEPCSEDQLDFYNAIETVVRPSLLLSVRQCIAEETCQGFAACSEAHEAHWQLANAQADPGTESECRESWGSECGDCACGFSCFKTCEYCSSRCAEPCRSNADCAGTSIGTLPTPVCVKAGSIGFSGRCEWEKR